METLNKTRKQEAIDNVVTKIQNVYDFETYDIEQAIANTEDAYETISSLTESLYEIEYFIYYYDAIKYLEENDQSLGQSIDIALEYGLKLENINSCTLANLLWLQETQGELFDIVTDLEDDFEIITNEIFKEQYKQQIVNSYGDMDNFSININFE